MRPFPLYAASMHYQYSISVCLFWGQIHEIQVFNSKANIKEIDSKEDIYDKWLTGGIYNNITKGNISRQRVPCSNGHIEHMVITY